MSILLAEIPLCYPLSPFREYVRERITCNRNDSYYFSPRSWKCSEVPSFSSFIVQALKISMEEGEIIKMNLQM
jgi:hypothetical protein